MIENLKERGIGFRSISDGMIDTTSASGELVLNIFSALAQFERRLIQERTKAGLAAARVRGRTGGRPSISQDHAKVVLANKLYCDRSVDLDDICRTLKISKSTLYRYATMCGNRDARSDTCAKDGKPASAEAVHPACTVPWMHVDQLNVGHPPPRWRSKQVNPLEQFPLPTKGFSAIML